MRMKEKGEMDRKRGREGKKGEGKKRGGGGREKGKTGGGGLRLLFETAA